MRYTTGTGNLTAPGERFRDLRAGWSPEVSVQGPLACGYIPAFTNPILIYGKMESTALWSEVADQRLRVLKSLTEKLSRADEARKQW